MPTADCAALPLYSQFSCQPEFMVRFIPKVALVAPLSLACTWLYGISRPLPPKGDSMP